MALVGLLGIGLSGCTDFAGYDLDYLWGYIPALATMRSSVSFDPYEIPRLPPEHSIPALSPMGDTPPRFAQTALDSAAATLTNPFAGEASAEVLRRGELVYLNQCSACHGPQGAGNGPVVGAGRFPFAPALNNGVAAARSDGYIYGVVVAGRGLMPPYGERLTETDRWAVVSYTRALQRNSGAVPAAPPVFPAAPQTAPAQPPAATQPAATPPAAAPATEPAPVVADTAGRS